MAEVTQDDVLELAGYMSSVEGRMMSIQASSNEILRKVNNFNEKASYSEEAYKRELKQLSGELAAMSDDVRVTQKVIIEIISNLKNTMKAEDLERFKRRVDLWAPEGLVTKGEAKMMIDDAFS
jgi:seryl-tRNA synthetase